MPQVTAEIHVAVACDGTLATWKDTCSIKPAVLPPVAGPIWQWVLGKQIRKRIEAFARGCADPVVLHAARRSLEARRGTQDGALD